MGLPLRQKTVGILLCAIAFALASCDDDRNRVKTTIPNNGEQNVAPRTIVAVRINDIFTERDIANTEPENITVRGDLSSTPYSGTISFARWETDVFRGQTIEEFPASDGGQVDPDEEPVVEPDDTLVFTLDSGVSFKEGEEVSVTVSHDITTRGTPINESVKFSFRIRGASAADGALVVERTTPATGSTIALRPDLRAGFNRAVVADGLEAGIRLTGDRSGAHPDRRLIAPTSNVEDVRVRLAADDSFVAGEKVSLTFASTIRESGAGQAALTPYHARFDVTGGTVAGGWSAARIPGRIASPVRVVAADWLEDAAGIELAVVGPSSIELFRQAGERVWVGDLVDVEADDPDADEPLPLVDAVPYDLDGDGSLDLVTLGTGAGRTELRTFEISDGATRFAVRGDAVSFDAGNARGIFVVDLDANGFAEVLVPHDVAVLPPAGLGGAPPASAEGIRRSLTLFERQLVAPDPEDLIGADPDDLTPRGGLVMTDQVFTQIDAADRIVAADLDRNGKVDLLIADGATLGLFANFGGIATRYALRRTGEVRLDEEGSAWAVGDLDGDGDEDLLVWGSRGARLYSNQPVSGAASSLLAEDLDGEDLPINAPVPARLALADMDGDSTLDLVHATRASLRVLVAGADGPLVYDVAALIDAPGGGAGLVAADLDGDTGLDAVVVDGASMTLVLAEDVTEPSIDLPTTFQIAAESAIDAEDGTLEVVIVGDLQERFTGYSLALEYDELLLEYRGFVPPEAYGEGVASFALCPDDDGIGCNGFAAAEMRFTQSTESLPGTGIALGTFLFDILEVDETTETRVELATIDGGDDGVFENSIRAREGGAAVDLPAEIGGEPLLLTLEPPLPPDLLLECRVVSRGDTSLEGEVTWSLPTNLTFSQFIIEVGDSVAATLPPASRSFSFTTDDVGVVPVIVTGTDSRGDLLARAECSVVGIHRPVVECVALAPGQNRLSWTVHSVDRFEISRNGRLLATVAGSVREFTDSSADSAIASVYEVAGVIAEATGPAGMCGPIGDPDALETMPPVIQSVTLLRGSAADSPNTLRVRWQNGEGYTAIALDLRRVDLDDEVLSERLGGTATEFTYAAATTPGGVSPGQYAFDLTGEVSGVASPTVSTRTVDVPVPTLAVPFTCSVDAQGNAILSWSRVWQGYTGLSLEIARSVAGVSTGEPERIELSLEDTSRIVPAIVPTGIYTFRLRAEYARSLPPALIPAPSSLERTCQLSFEPRVFVDDVDAGVGIDELEIPIDGEVLGPLNGFEFTLELPSFLQIDPTSGLRDVAPGGTAELEILPGSSAATIRAHVTVTGIMSLPPLGPDGSALPVRRLATLVAAVPLDFSLPAQTPLAFVGPAVLDFPNVGATEVEAEAGVINVFRRFMALDTAEVAAGSSEVIRLTARATFNAPAPDYALIGFTIHLKWDPDALELLPVRAEDQTETVIFGRGTVIFPTDLAMAEARATGEVAVPWLAIDFTNPSELDSLEPGNDLALMVFRFRSRLGATAPTTFLPVEFLTGREVRNPTTFIPEFAVPGAQDLQGLVDGGVRVVSQGQPLGLNSITPEEGSLLGGHEAVLAGGGFRSAPGLAIDFLLPAAGGGTTTRAVTQILALDDTSVRFIVPDSQLRALATPPTVATVRVRSSDTTLTLEDAYTYMAPRVDSSDRQSGLASGGQLMVLRGAGFAPQSSVAFVIPGLAVPFPASVTSVSNDGAEIRLLTPSLVGQESALASIVVTVPGVGSVALEDAYEVLPDGGGGDELRLLGVDPASAFICGGERVVLTGENFLPGLIVRFGTITGESVAVLDAGTVEVFTPEVPEGTTLVDVSVENPGGSVAGLDDGFTFAHPAGPFVRGDVDGSGNLSITDSVALSELVSGVSFDFPENLDAADANDDGVLDGGDVNAILAVLFGEIIDLPAPFDAPGLDPTPDDLTSCP